MSSADDAGTWNSGDFAMLGTGARAAAMRPYIIYYKYKCPGDKKPGAVKQFRIYANNMDEARRLATRYANYPDIEVLSIQST